MERKDVITDPKQTIKNLKVESDIKKKQIAGGIIATIVVSKTFQ